MKRSTFAQSGHRFALMAITACVTSCQNNPEIAASDPLLTCTFDANRLENVLQYLQEQSGLQITVDWKAYEAWGVERDLPITLELQDEPLSLWLRLIFSQISHVPPPRVTFINSGYLVEPSFEVCE